MTKENPKIAIVWDFDQTLTPKDSTTITANILLGRPLFDIKFWEFIKDVTGKTFVNPKTGDEETSEWEHLLGSDAPAWMYYLSKTANAKKIPLDSDFFKQVIVDQIDLFPNVIKFLRKLKKLEELPDFKKLNLEIHHFIVSAGLKELVEQVFPEKLITHTFGCRYAVFLNEKGEPENVPAFCMDETMKTRALFEISKGSFIDPKKGVNKWVAKNDRFAPFDNFIYIGDGPTDVPSLSLTRYNGGLGVVVYNEDNSDEYIHKRLKKMSSEKRADLITPANFSLKGELYKFIEARCIQIKQRYEAESF